jgi:hypothetical protein
VPPKRSWKRHVQELPAEQRTEADEIIASAEDIAAVPKPPVISHKSTFECITFDRRNPVYHIIYSQHHRTNGVTMTLRLAGSRVSAELRAPSRARYALRTEGISSPVLGRSVMQCDEKLHHSLKSPACSCVSSTLRISSQTRIAAPCDPQQNLTKLTLE